MEVVFGRGHLHRLAEDLQTIAIGIEEVDTFREEMISREVHPDTVVLQPLIEFTQLCFPTLDLQRRVAQARTAHRLVIGHLDDGDVVVLLPKGEEAHLELLIELHQLHAQGLSIELDRRLRVAAAKDDVSDFVDLCHNTLHEFKIDARILPQPRKGKPAPCGPCRDCAPLPSRSPGVVVLPSTRLGHTTLPSLRSAFMPMASVNGIKLYYEVTGSGYPLLFSHEFAGDYRSWEVQVRYFSRRYQVITYNARGYPPSEVPEDINAYSQEQAADDIVGLMHHLSIAQAHLVGLSMGGYAVLHFGLRYPTLARSLVVAGCGYGSVASERQRFQQDSGHVAQRIEREGMRAMAAVYSKGR